MINRQRNRFLGFVALIFLIGGLAFAQVDSAYAQNCTTRVTENVIHSHRGPKVMITEHRTCGFETVTRYHYEDHANGYTNEYRHYRSPHVIRKYRHRYNHRRYNGRHYPHFELQLRGDRLHMYYRGRP